MGLDADAWASFAHDPRDPAHAVLRAGDADRVLTANLLTEAYAEGRIDLAEHDERAELAQSARLLGDLVPLLDDLVPVLPPSPSTSAGLTVAARADLEVRAHQEWAAQRRSAVMGFIAPTLITWAVFLGIVLSSGWHFPWPLIVMAVTAVNLLRVQVRRADLVADNLEQLEKKRAKALAKQAKQRKALPSAERERLDPDAVRAASELARQKARDAARVVEQDVVRRFNERFRPPGPS